MKRVLQILALAVAFAAVSFWLAAGAQRGWTKTAIPIKSVDEVTGIEGITYKKRFVPGLDFLGASLLGAGILAGASLIFRNKNTTTNNKTSTTARMV
jgi:hypothetical protein